MLSGRCSPVALPHAAAAIRPPAWAPAAGGSILGGAEYVGSQIFATRPNATLPADVAARFDDAIQEAGLAGVLPSISGYCPINYSASCQYPAWLPTSGPASSPAGGPESAPAPMPATADPASAAVLTARLGAAGLLALAALAALL